MDSPIPSFKKRYVFKLITNFLGAFINLGTQVLIPRGLGPAEFGNFNFLSNFFTQVTNFLDMGTSTAFYTKLSQRPQDRDLITFYWHYILVAAILVLLFPPLTWLINMYPWLWPGQRGRHITLVAVGAFLIWLNQVVTSMADAYGLTVGVEKWKVAQRILGLLALGILFGQGVLNLTSLAITNILLQSFLLLATGRMILHKKLPFLPEKALSRNYLAQIGKEFFAFVSPLFIMSVVILVVGLLDRWLLQTFGGSVEQGFFGLAIQVATVCTLFSSAITPLLMREFAIATQSKDTRRMADLLNRSLPGLSAITTIVVCFPFFHVELVTRFIGGLSFSAASNPVSLLMFLPILSTQVQILGAVFLACGETPLYSKISIWVTLAGLPITLALIAPPEWGGLALGGTGLALKTIAMGLISVALHFIYIARKLTIDWVGFLKIQLTSLLLGLSFSYFSCWAMRAFMAHDEILAFLVSGVLYGLCLGGTFCFSPEIFGFNRKQLQEVLQRMGITH